MIKQGIGAALFVYIATFIFIPSVVGVTEFYDFEDSTTMSFAPNSSATATNVPCSICVAGSTKELRVQAIFNSQRVRKSLQANHAGVVNVTYFMNFTAGGVGLLNNNNQNSYEITRVSCESGTIFAYPAGVSTGSACSGASKTKITQLINLTNGTYEVYIGDVFKVKTPTGQNVTFLKYMDVISQHGGGTSTAAIDNISITSEGAPFGASTINIKNETTRADINADVYFFNSQFSRNITNNNNWEILIYNITTTESATFIWINSTQAETFTFYVDRTDTEPRFFYVTLPFNTSSNQTFYLLPESNSSILRVSIQDETGNNVENATLLLKRYYFDINRYETVAMARTDTDGRAYFDVQLTTPIYSVVVQYNERTVHTMTPRPFVQYDIDNGITIQAVIQDVYYNPYKNLLNVPVALRYDNTTKSFKFNWVDTSNIVTNGCLNVERHVNNQIISVYSACSTNLTGALNSSTIDESKKGTYKAIGLLYANGSSYTVGVLNKDFQSFGDTKTAFGFDALVIVAIILIASIPIAIYSPALTLVVAGLSLAMGVILGLLPIGMGLVAAFIGALIIIGVKISR